MATATPISMDEYLNSGYGRDAEFVDGELKERPAVFSRLCMVPPFLWLALQFGSSKRGCHGHFSAGKWRMMRPTIEWIAIFLSVYGAVLSTVNTVIAYRKDRADVVLKVRSNMTTSGHGGHYAGMTLTIVTAINRGKRPVTIEGFGAKQLDSFTELLFKDIRPNLPCELTEGQSVKAYLDEKSGSLDHVESYYIWDSLGRFFFLHKASRPRRLLSRFKRKFGDVNRLRSNV